MIFGFELLSPPKELAGPLVLRLRIGDEQSRRERRGLALMDAAGTLGCRVPRIRLAEPEVDDLGGPFFIMDRVAGRSIGRWLTVPILLGVITSLFVWHAWSLLAGYLFGSLVLGLAMGVQQRRLHSLELEDVRHIYNQYGLTDTDMDVGQTMHSVADELADANLEEFLPGLKWLEDNLPALREPRLCHGDFHPGNVLGTWTRVTGIIDWDGACIADRERRPRSWGPFLIEAVL